MTDGFFPPYLLPGEDRVDASEWKLFWRGESVEFGPNLDDWASGDDLRLTRVVTIDAAGIRQDCALPEDAPLDLVVTWFGNTTKMRRCVFNRRISERHNDVEAVLPGAEIGGTVTVSTRIVLGSDLPNGSPGAPRLRGSVLAGDVSRVMVEGDGSMFPMAVIDFDTRAYDSRASWHVETSTDMGADFSAVFQVVVNEQDADLVQAIEADKATPRQKALLDELSSGVMQTVLELAYAMKDQGALNEEFPDGTVGDVLGRLVEQTGEIDLGDLSDAVQISRRRTVFQGMARRMAAGRVF